MLSIPSHTTWVHLEQLRGRVNSMTVLQGRLADRDSWSAVGECPIEKTMALLGTKSAMLIMREAYYGTTRFEDCWRRGGVTKPPASARLTELGHAGLLARRPSKE